MDGTWNTPVNAASPLNDTLQIWRIDLDGRGANPCETSLLLDGCASVLSPDEREHAGRMRVGRPSEEFTVGRGCLRRLLGAAMRRNPSDLVLEKGLHGKPYVRPEPGLVAPSFNVAHSHGVVLIGLSMAGEIGVDVEFVDRTIDLEGVARTAFHMDEVARVEAATSLEDRLAVFYRCWTRKEALAKADGRGLLLDPTTYVAGLDEPGEQGVALPEALAGDKFFVREIDAGDSHRAALATRSANCIVSTYRFPFHFGTVFPE